MFTHFSQSIEKHQSCYEITNKLKLWLGLEWFYIKLTKAGRLKEALPHLTALRQLLSKDKTVCYQSITLLQIGAFPDEFRWFRQP